MALGPVAAPWLIPQQNGMVERVIRTLKKQCIHRHRFDSIQHAARVIGDWIGFYNNRWPHQALAMRTPAEAFIFVQSRHLVDRIEDEPFRL
uniref:integrase core domain-containing protein n=1 Tax=Falsigemmobacter faecalis TaxID=2488730 RepID=UPI0038995F43